MFCHFSAYIKNLGHYSKIDRNLPGISTEGRLTFRGDVGSDNTPPPDRNSSDDPRSILLVSVDCVGTVKGICFMLQGRRIIE